MAPSVTCPRCPYEKEAGAKFCEECLVDGDLLDLVELVLALLLAHPVRLTLERILGLGQDAVR